MTSTRCTPYRVFASFRNSRKPSLSVILRAETWGTGSRPAPRSAATASSVRGSGSPGSEGMYTHVSVGSNAATSAARCSSRGEISREPPATSSESRAPGASIALAGNDIGFIQEPEAAVLLQDLARGIEVFALAQHLAEALVVDLRDIDCRIPGGEQRRGADARGDLGRQGMHVVAEYRARIGIRVE